MQLHGVRLASALLAFAAAFVCSVVLGCEPSGEGEHAGPDSCWPQLLGLQYTFILQHQSSFNAPYSGRLSLDTHGDTQPTHTIGLYSGWAPTSWAQVYFDLEKFMGAGVSGATGLGGLTNGDVIRSGSAGLSKVFYIARQYIRLMLPVGDATEHMDTAQDQLPGREATSRVEFKFGALAVNDDFDHNRYAGAARTQFLNWSLWANTAWDYAADTRGYTYGAVLGWISPRWTLKYGGYLMPVRANGQKLEDAPLRARGDNVELSLLAPETGTTVRLLGYRNIARMGIYEEALRLAAAGGPPAIVADDRDGRIKYGAGLNIEQALADEGETGVFARLGWNDGHTESFAFTEVDRLLSFGGQLSGAHWMRAEDRVGAAVAIEGLSAPHREYLAAGGTGFLLGDGRLAYAHEQILEIYYRLGVAWALPDARMFVGHTARLQLSPDFQLIRNPGFNHDRGAVRFWGVRVHAEL
ncbi:MAG: carbohydrate porin [Sinobacteraceae bacterium]|nr:carbohydrate porin [Nevskiaceae bacterium]